MQISYSMLYRTLSGGLVIGLAVIFCGCDTGSTGYVSANTTTTSGGTGASGSTGAGQTSSTTTSTDPTATSPAADPISTAPISATGIALGLRLKAGGAAESAYAIDDNFWPATISTLGQSATGSVAAASLVIGTNDNGTCTLSMPKASSTTGTLKNVEYVVDPKFDSLLTSLDASGARVLLEVQPGKATLSSLATAVLSAYGTHKSVVGLCVDVQYKGTTSFSSTASMSNSEANSLVATIQSVQPMDSNILLYVKASSAANLPDPSTPSVVFVNDNNGFGSQDAMLAAQTAWASAFAPASVQFDIGDLNDVSWWCAADAPTATKKLIRAALQAGTNVTGLYWQADGIVSLYPKVTCASAGTTTTGVGTQTGTGSTTPANPNAPASGSTTSGTTSAGGTSTGTTSSGATSTGSTTSGSSSSGTATSGSTSSTTSSTGAPASGSTSSGSATSGATSSGSTSASSTAAGSTSSSGGTGSTTAGGSTTGTGTAGTSTGAGTSTTGTAGSPNG